MAESATLAARAEALSKIGAPLLGVIYVLGFIVSALHLARFGVSSVGLGNAQYVLAGIWLIAYAFTPKFVAPGRGAWGIGKKIGATLLGLAGMAILTAFPVAYIRRAEDRKVGGSAPAPVTLHLDGTQRDCNVLLVTAKTVVILEQGKAQELPRDSVKGIDHR